MGAMQRTPANDPEAPWLALFCLGVLLTSLAGTTCLAIIALYTAPLKSLEPILACFAAGAVLMIGAAAGLDYLAIARARPPRH